MKKSYIKLKKYITQAEYVFLIPALFFSLLTAFLLPQLAANDENMHFMRSYQLTEAQVKYFCELPQDVRERGFDDIYKNTPSDFSFDSTFVDNADRIQTNCGTAAAYNPVMHLPQAVGVFIAKLAHPSTGVMILLGRIANAIFYCVALFLIIRKAKIGKWIIVIIALMPTMIHSAGSLSSDVMNNVILIGFIVYVFNLFVQKSQLTKRQVATLILLSAAIALTKTPNLLMLVIIAFLPSRILPTLAIGKKHLPKYATRLIMTFFAAVAAIAVMVVWSLLYGESPNSATVTSNIVAERPYLFLKILFNTYINPDVILGGVPYSDWLLRGAVGSFASFQYHLPYYMVLSVLALLLLVGLRKNQLEENLLSKNGRLLTAASISVFIIIVLVMTYGLYAAWAVLPEVLGPGANYAQGLQGRYYTPLLVLLVPLFIFLRKYIRVEFSNEGLLAGLVLVIMTVSLMFYSTQTFHYAMTVM